MLMKRNYLLPHVCQRIGVWLLLATLVLFCAYFIACMVIAFKAPDADNVLSSNSLFTHYWHLAISLMMGVAIVLIAFSREKYEDEMIDSVRKSSVVTVAYVLFIVYMAITLLRCCVNTDFIDMSGNTVSLTADLMDTVCNPILFFLFYEIVFRTRLAKLRKALKNEE